MRRTTITALACLAAAAFPAAAIADHGDGNDNGDGHNQPGQEFHDHGQNNFVDIGKVTAFSGGKLTITFTDGNTITASVDRQSQISCEDMNDFRDHDRGGDNGAGDNGNGNDNGDRGGDNNQNCVSLLTAGTQVTQASVEETQNGAFWDEVDLDAGMHHDNHDS
jgi:hypothetical protein